MNLTLEKYNTEKSQIIDTLRGIEKLIKNLETNDKFRRKLLERHKELEIDAENFMNNQYPIAVLATWNAGKSTFLNALMGRSILPMKNKSYTSEITKIRYSENPKIELKYIEGKVEEIPLSHSLEEDFLVQYVTVDGKESNEHKIEEVVVNYPLDICKEGIVLIDTPGVHGINESHDRITYKVIPNAKAIIMLVTADSPGGSGEVEFLRRILAGRDQNEYDILFVINKTDSISKEELEDAISSVEQAIAQVKDDEGAPLIENPIVIPVSSYMELQYQLYKNELITLDGMSNDVKLYYKNYRGRRKQIETQEDVEHLKEASNFQVLKNTLNDAFMGLDTTKRLLSSLKSGMSKLCSEEILKYLRKNLNSLENDKSYEEMVQEVAQILNVLQESERKKEFMVFSFENEMNEVIDDYVDHIQDDWRNKVIYDMEKYINGLSLNQLKKNGSTFISNEFKRLIQREYYQSSNRMSKLVENIINKYAYDFQQLIKQTDKLCDEIDYGEASENSNFNFTLRPFEKDISFGLSDTNRMMVTGGMAFAGIQAGALLGSIVPGIGNLIGGILGGIIGGVLGFFGFGPSESKVKRNIIVKVKPDLQKQCDLAFQKQRTSLINSLETMKVSSIDMFNQQFNDYKVTIENSYQEALHNMQLKEEEQERMISKLKGDIQETYDILQII